MASFRLTKQAKLLKTDDFSSVFNLRKRVSTHFLLIWYKSNQLNHARLGMVVSKRLAKLAVERNYMRRVLRELFRLNQQQLLAFDMIIQVQKKFSHADFEHVKQEFEQLMLKIASR